MATNLYATDGHCHNAQPGTYGHECGKPATWIGTDSNGFQSGFCDDCKANGYEARGLSWRRKDPLDYDFLIRQASEHVPETVRLDMCRHESATDPTYWLFREKDQIGVVAYEPQYAAMWRASRMHRGMPTAQQRFGDMESAFQFAAS